MLPRDRPAAAFAWLYRKLGKHYPTTFLAVELHSALLVIAGMLGLFTLYYDGSDQEFLAEAVMTLVLTEITISIVLVRGHRHVRPIQRWIAGQRDPDSTAQAWSAAVSLPLTLLKRDLPVPIALTVIPGCLASVVILDLDWYQFFPILAASLVAIGYVAILHYLVVEAGMRPVLIEINRDVSPRLSAQRWTLPLRARLMVAVPLISVITGLVVAALTSGGQGDNVLGFDVLVAVGVAMTISLELSVLLSKSILRPIGDLHRATEAVREGHYDEAVPVTTADELGELAASFNQMVKGLRERETIREAFGTYLDKEVAEYILSDAFDEQGQELEVSVLFCDVRDFTRFSAGAEATEVVRRLNETCRRGRRAWRRSGRRARIGDGLLAVFGAPEPYPDHADRAVRAAIEMACAANDPERDGLRVGVGVNTGRVVAGSIGGAGRLNFSVIGDSVNVAARVEAATRDTGDDVLITAETKRHLNDDYELEPRGAHELKGLDEPVELYAALVGEREGAADVVHASPGRGLAI